MDEMSGMLPRDESVFLLDCSGNRRHVVEGASPFVVGEEEDGARPGGAGHQRVDDFGDFELTGEDGLPGTGMLVVVAVTGFDERKGGQRVLADVGVVLRQRRDMAGVNAEGVGRIADRAGGLRGGLAGRAGGIVVHVFGGVAEDEEIGAGEFGALISAFVRGAHGLIDGVVDLPRNAGLIEFLEDGLNAQLGQVIVGAGIVSEALRGTAGEGGDAVVDALAGDGREPTVGNRELRRHVVVVVQEFLVVIAHGAFAVGVSKGAGAGSAGVAAFGKAFGGVDEAIHVDRPGGGEGPAADVAVAFQPGAAHVVDAGAGQLEGIVGRA